MNKKAPTKAKKPIEKKKPTPQERDDLEPELKQSRLKRLLFGEPKPDISEIMAGTTTILDILSPTAVDSAASACFYKVTSLYEFAVNYILNRKLMENLNAYKAQ